jgi:hypothetical protein
MPARAKDGARLAKLVRMAIPICQAAQRQCPRRGPGRPREFEDWQIAVLILVGVLKQRKSKSAQYRFLHEHQALLQQWLKLDRFPARSTYFTRYRRAYPVFQAAVAIQGRLCDQEGLVESTAVAVDKSLLAARGPVRHRRRGRPCRASPGVDAQADWGYSEHHGWVYGYSFEVVVSATKGSLVLPLLASADVASRHESRSLAEKVAVLPDATRYVLADRGYDSNDNGEGIEYDREGRPTGRHLVCPLQARAGKPKVGKVRHRGRRERRRQHRQHRLDFFESRQGQRLYAQRSRTIEPFNEWFKQRFDLHDRVWHRGLANNQTQLMAAIFDYQLLVRYNHQQGGCRAQIQWILDGL